MKKHCAMSSAYVISNIKNKSNAIFFYKGHTIRDQKLDLLVEKEVVVEIKPLSKMPEVALAQTLSYLKATNLKRGLIINFGEKRLVDGIKRVSL